MAKPLLVPEFKYKNRTRTRSAARTWRPGKWALGPGSTAVVAAGPSRGIFASPTYLTVTTPTGEAILMEANGGRETAKAHKLAAEILADAR